MESINQSNKPNLTILYRHFLDILYEHYSDYTGEEESLCRKSDRSQLSDKLVESVKDMLRHDDEA